MITRLLKMPLVLALAIASPAAAQHLDISLSEDDLRTMSPSARAEYEQAVEALDRANHPDAREHLAIAAAQAPEVVDLQFLVLEMSGDHFLTLDSGSAVAEAERCIAILERVVGNPQATADQMARARTAIQHLTAQIQSARMITQSLEAARDEIVRNLSELEDRVAMTTAQRANRAPQAASRPSPRGRINGRDAIDANPLLLPGAINRPQSDTPLGDVPMNERLPHNVGL